MSTVLMPITLVSAAAAGLINIWIATRVGGARRASKVSIGDGGDLALTARMRAHANFVEYTPFVLILIGIIEYNIGSPMWLLIVSAVYLFGRVLHPLGMDGLPRARVIGTITTLSILGGLSLYAAALPFFSGTKTAPAAEAAPTQG
jgi:uncharacterized membrane protein YecN with MAPEG domain